MFCIPITCVDDFYTNPDEVRKFALSQEFFPSDGQWPGKRTKELDLVDPTFYDLFCKKIFSIFTDHSVSNYFVRTSFQLIDKFDENPASFKNKGWVHIDKNCMFAGVIYLTPDANPETGTSIFKLTDESTIDHDSHCKQNLYAGKGISEKYEETITRHNGSYTETVRFNNVYNRMICFDSSQPHGVNSFYTDNEPRLTQVFFVFNLESNSIPPIQRHKKFL